MYFFRAYISAIFGSQTKSSIFYDNNSNIRAILTPDFAVSNILRIFAV